MITTNVYLNFNGNCEEAFEYYRSIFGGEFTYLSRFGDIPPGEDKMSSDADKNKIMHVENSMLANSLPSKHQIN